MSNDNVIELKKPDTIVDDPITSILRQGARKLLAQALETEIKIFISQYNDLTDLHYIVQIAMVWSDDNLYQFRIHGKRYGISLYV